MNKSMSLLGFPDSSVGKKKKKIHLQCRRPWFDSWVGKICWRRDRLPTPVFLGFPGGSTAKESACNAGDPGSIPELGRSTREGNGYRLQYGQPFQYSWASLVAQLVKNLPAMRETWVQSLAFRRSPGEGKGYPLQYSGPENSMDCIVHGVAKSQIQLSNCHFISWPLGSEESSTGTQDNCRLEPWLLKQPRVHCVPHFLYL